MKAIFVTGTDTNAGKTVITGLVARYLLRKGYRVITQKWVQTGVKNFPVDIARHLEIMGKKKKDITQYLPFMSPYNFKFPASPHLAARMERKSVSISNIKKSFKFLLHKFDYVIIEGSGGALVPITKKKLVIDIAKELNLPVLIVAGNRLGAINHTLLTLEAVRRRKMRVAGIIFNNRQRKLNRIIMNDNPKIVNAISGQRILGILPQTKDRKTLYRQFAPIGAKLVTYFNKGK